MYNEKNGKIVKYSFKIHICRKLIEKFNKKKLSPWYTPWSLTKKDKILRSLQEKYSLLHKREKKNQQQLGVGFCVFNLTPCLPQCDPSLSHFIQKLLPKFYKQRFCGGTALLSGLL